MTRPKPDSVVWLSADEATDHIAFKSKRALYEAVRRGTIPVHRLGRRLRFDRAELDRLLSKPK